MVICNVMGLVKVKVMEITNGKWTGRERRRGSKRDNVLWISTWKGSKMCNSRATQRTGEIAFSIMAIDLSMGRARNTKAMPTGFTRDRFFCGVADDTRVNKHKINHGEILRWGGRM